MFRSHFAFVFLCLATCLASLSQNIANAQPVAPAFSSRPNAPYTLYLNFAGFSWTGNWGGGTPGVTPAYNGQTGPTFTAQEQANIKNIWTRVAEAYSIFNVNVTTVDPAVTVGGLSPTAYLQRQQYYDATPRVMHTIIGNANENFQPNAGGVSFVGVWAGTSTSGQKTNWVFTNRLGGYGSFHNIYTATTHENGHAGGLSHQGDYVGSTRINEYSRNNDSPTLAPFMGVGYGASRNTWRVGRVNTNVNTIHNDVQRMLQQNSGMGLFNDGIGRTIATATPLALNGTQIDNIQAAGVIVPVSTTNPNPIGVNNYTRGFFSFTTAGGQNTITVNAGSQRLIPGVADPGAILDATLRILDANGVQVAVSNTTSLSETLSLNLSAGNYFIEVSSAGGKAASLGPNGNWHAAQLYDLGSYFLTGTINAIPEPGSMLMLLVGTLCVLAQRRRLGRI